MQLTQGQQDVIAADGHLLIVGGPGSGKTTISILKAAQIVEKHLWSGQSILFLSFARATFHASSQPLSMSGTFLPAQQKRIDVETYYSFGFGEFSRYMVTSSGYHGA